MEELMIVACPHCGARHTLPASKIPQLGGILTCRRCEANFDLSLPPRDDGPDPESATLRGKGSTPRGNSENPTIASETTGSELSTDGAARPSTKSDEHAGAPEREAVSAKTLESAEELASPSEDTPPEAAAPASSPSEGADSEDRGSEVSALDAPPSEGAASKAEPSEAPDSETTSDGVPSESTSDGVPSEDALSEVPVSESAPSEAANSKGVLSVVATSETDSASAPSEAAASETPSEGELSEGASGPAQTVSTESRAAVPVSRAAAETEAALPPGEPASPDAKSSSVNGRTTNDPTPDADGLAERDLRARSKAAPAPAAASGEDTPWVARIEEEVSALGDDDEPLLAEEFLHPQPASESAEDEVEGLRLEVSDGEPGEGEEQELLPAPVSARAPASSPEQAPETRVFDDLPAPRSRGPDANFDTPDSGIEAALAERHFTPRSVRSHADDDEDDGPPAGAARGPASLDPTLAGEAIPAPLAREAAVATLSAKSATDSPGPRSPVPTPLPTPSLRSSRTPAPTPTPAMRAPERSAASPLFFPPGVEDTRGRASPGGSATGDLGRPKASRTPAPRSSSERSTPPPPRSNSGVRTPRPRTGSVASAPPRVGTISPTPLFPARSNAPSPPSRPLSPPVPPRAVTGGVLSERPELPTRGASPSVFRGPLDPDLPPEPPPAEARPRRGTPTGVSAGTVGLALAATGVSGLLVGSLVLSGISSEPRTPLEGPSGEVKTVARAPVESAATVGAGSGRLALSDVAPPREQAFLTTAARLASRVGGSGGPEVPAGTVVRRLANHDGWALVLVEPAGPVGFVEADRLAQQKPIQAMAREFVFEGCAAPELPCLSSARSQRDLCLDGCRSLGSRCEAACRIAFEQCQRDCRR